MRKIENGFIYIITSLVKDNLLLEDQYLKSNLISPNEFSNLINENISGCIVFCDKTWELSNTEAPICSIIFENKAQLATLIGKVNYEIFKKCRLPQNTRIWNEKKFKTKKVNSILLIVFMCKL